jgi:hypothetical protein
MGKMYASLTAIVMKASLGTGSHPGKTCVNTFPCYHLSYDAQTFCGTETDAPPGHLKYSIWYLKILLLFIQKTFILYLYNMWISKSIHVVTVTIWYTCSTLSPITVIVNSFFFYFVQTVSNQNDFQIVNISIKFLFFDVHCFVNATGCENKSS